MKNKAKLFGIYLPVYLAVTLTTVIMRTVALFMHFDAETGYFTEKTLISISDILVIAAAIFFLSYVYTARRDMKLIPDFTSPATYIPTGVVSVAIIFLFFSLVKRSISIFKKIEELKEYATPSSLSLIPAQRVVLIIIFITAAFAILSLIHFALTALVESHSSTGRANFGICTVVFLSLYSMYLYFSTDLPINAPNKALDQMAYLFAAVFFLYETRLSFGRERWRHYIAFGFIASVVSAYSAIPSVILCLAEGTVTANSVYELALTLSIFIFITSRLFLTGNLIENKESLTAVALIKASESRDEQINPIPEKPSVIDVEGEALDPIAEEDADGNQLTIDDMVAEEQTSISDTDTEADTEEAAAAPADNDDDTNFTSEN